MLHLSDQISASHDVAGYRQDQNENAQELTEPQDQTVHTAGKEIMQNPRLIWLIWTRYLNDELLWQHDT